MTDSDTIRVLVADDHPIFRAGLTEAIAGRQDLELVGEASTGTEANAEIARLVPDVAVIDMKMPGLDGMEVLRQVLGADVPCRVLFLTGYMERDTVYRAVEAGAAGYLSKDAGADAVCDAIAAVAAGQVVLDPASQTAIAGGIRMRTASGPSPLSPREREILRLTAAGGSAAEIAGELFLSPATVKTHLHRIYNKLGVSDRAAAVAEAMRCGLLE